MPTQPVPSILQLDPKLSNMGFSQDFTDISCSQTWASPRTSQTLACPARGDWTFTPADESCASMGVACPEAICEPDGLTMSSFTLSNLEVLMLWWMGLGAPRPLSSNSRRLASLRRESSGKCFMCLIWFVTYGLAPPMGPALWPGLCASSVTRTFSNGLGARHCCLMPNPSQ